MTELDVDSWHAGSRAPRNEIQLSGVTSQIGKILPNQARVQIGHDSYQVWVSALTEPGSDSDPGGSALSAAVGTGELRRRLSGDGMNTFSIEIQETSSAEVALAPAHKITSVAEVLVMPEDGKRLGIGLRTQWRLVVANGKAYPIRVKRMLGGIRSEGAELQPNQPEPPRIKMALAVRMMTGCKKGQEVELAVPQRSSVKERWRGLATRVRLPLNVDPPPWSRKWLLPSVGLVILFFRALRQVGEILLRAALRSPRYSFHSERARPGDDSTDIIRLDPAIFPLLGVSPGSRVELNWFGKKTLVRVLEREVVGTDDKMLEQLQAVGTVSPLDPQASRAIDRLSVEIGSRVREQLGMPPDSIVEVRRSVSSAVSSHLVQLSIPLLGAVFAGAAFAGSHWQWAAVIGVAAAGLILGLAPLRIPKEPAGLWP